MHEFSLCQSLLREACKIAVTRTNELSRPQIAKTPITLITGLKVRMGLFAGIEKSLLRRAFDIAIQDHHRNWQGSEPYKKEDTVTVTFAPLAQLEIEEMPGAIYCRECNCNYLIDQGTYNSHYLSCSVDNEHHTHLVGGNELLLVNVQLQHISLEAYWKSDNATAQTQDFNRA